MSPNPIRLQVLFDKYFRSACTAEEQKEMWERMGNLSDNDTVAEQLTDLWQDSANENGPANNADGLKMYDRVLATVKNREINYDKVHRIKFPKWAAAASIILVIAATSGYVYLHNGPTDKVIVKAPVFKSDIQPGGNKAVLTLANGTTILLDNAANGTLAKQGNASVQKLSNGQLVYNASKDKQEAVLMNTLSTPRGGQYQLVLPDGTKVWLNAASSITYPTAFFGAERIVSIVGEAYFEVVHNSKMPFKVKVGEQVVEDIGTSFNINAYTNESNITTTLLEGSVKINAYEHSQILKPGEQAKVTDDRTIAVVHYADLDQTMAWKTGLFNFNYANLATVMRELERWYDIEVKYEGAIPQRTFQGKITRDLNLSQVVKLLNDVNVSCRINGKTLIVQQKD